MSIDRWITKKTSSLEGKRVVISGSTGGIGRALAKYLAYLGAELVLLDRNEEKSRALAKELTVEFPRLRVSHIFADMSDMDSVKRARTALSEMEIDYLILNAGAYSIPRHTCTTGFDNVYQINFVSPYYLARGLLPKIRARGGRVIAVGSIAHNYSKIDESDIDFSGRKKASLVYGNAKRYLTYSLLALSEGDCIVAHPGISFTGITDHYPPLIFALIKYPMKIIFMRPRRAALPILYGLFADVNSDEWIGPLIFDVWGMPRVKRLRTASLSEQKTIVNIAENIYKSID